MLISIRTVNTMESSTTKYLDLDGLNYFWNKFKNRFVEKDGKKGLSDNNYTDDAKSKVATISAIPVAKIDEIFNS